MGEQEQPVIKVYDRDNAVQAIQNSLAKAKSDFPSLKNMLPGFLGKIGGVMDSVAGTSTPEISRTQVKELLSTFGIDSNTPDTFRLVEYRDRNQEVLFKGTAKQDGSLELTESLVLTEGQQGFKRLPKPLVVPPVKAKSVVGKDGVVAEVLELPAEQSKKLAADVTLMALAERASKSQLAVGSNATLPQKGRDGGKTLA